ncbi:MAG: 4Fe-4S binding protein [Hyphomonadaceae bacterium]|nr:4Fe-4S binding protein [Clostridia bacterium]
MNNKTTKIIRGSILALFLIGLSISAYLHQTLGGGVAPSIHALCPFGGLESLYTFFGSGTFIAKIYAGTLILFAITLVLAIVFRRSFCGLICPFGALQEFFAKLGKKLFGKRFVIPKKMDKPFRFLKYVILFITVFYAWKTAGLWMAPYDPWSAYAHLPEGLGSVWESSAAGLIILVITIVGSMLYDRFFCKYLCPMGALYGIIGKISPYRVVRNEDKCVNCGLCTKNCPVNIDVQHTNEVKTAECLNCQTCVLNCPKAGALEMKAGKKTVNPFVAIVLVLALFFVPILISQAAGVYNLVPGKLKAGETLKLENIKGYMTIKEVAEQAKMEVKEVYKALGIPEVVPKETKMKEIKNIAPEYDFEKMKESTGIPTSTEKTKTEVAAPTQKLDASLVRGSMTIKEAAEATKTELEDFRGKFKIPENVPSETKMKEIVNIVSNYDFEKIKSSFN